MTPANVYDIMNPSFIDKVDKELKRAERYRIFISLVVLDLTFIQKIDRGENELLVQHLTDFIRANVREIDNVAMVSEHQLGILFPETPRQGAEIVGKRLSSLIRGKLSEKVGGPVEDLIPIEMASYPDAAGARSVADVLQEFSRLSQN